MSQGIDSIDFKITFTGGKRANIKGEYNNVENFLDLTFTDGRKKPLDLEEWEAADVQIFFKMLADTFGELAKGNDVDPETIIDANEYRKEE